MILCQQNRAGLQHWLFLGGVGNQYNNDILPVSLKIKCPKVEKYVLEFTPNRVSHENVAVLLNGRHI